MDNEIWHTKAGAAVRPIDVIKLAMNRWNRLIGMRRNVSAPNDLRIGSSCFIGAPNNLTIGHNVAIGTNCWIGCNGSIGNGVLISSYVGIAGKYDHKMEQIGEYISRAEWIYNFPERSDDKDHRVIINDDVWIGLGALILSNVVIGRGAVIGVGAVVVKDVAPYAIVGGNPAVKIGTRFNDQEIVAHEAALARKYGT
jgi:acetyltransferase-like isoleucine patch superfamily enzyme